MDSILMKRVARKLVVTPALIVALLSGCGGGGGKPRTPAVGGAASGAASQPAGCASMPDAVAKSPKELALASFLKAMKLDGKPVLIEFGMIGCALSEKGLDEMIALQKANTVPGLAFVRVEGNPDAAVADAYYRDKAPSFPVCLDSRSVLARALSATAYPTFLLADKFGHIRYQGKYPQENLAPWGKALVAEDQDPGRTVPLFGARELDVNKLLANKLPDLQDNIRSLGEYMGAGGLMVLFVDTSCPFSATALRDMPVVSTALAEQKINTVVLNTDDAKGKVQSFYAGHNPGAPVLYDVGAATREDWNVHSVPIAVYISPAMKVGYYGEAVWANMGSAIEQSLSLAAGTLKFTVAGTGFG